MSAEKPSYDQQELFPVNVQPPVDIDTWSANIGANARPFEPEDRTSEAAKDQGWGRVETPKEIPSAGDKLQSNNQVINRTKLASVQRKADALSIILQAREKLLNSGN